MQEIARHRDQQAATGPVVWSLERGQMFEGGRVLGVSLDHALTAGRFITEAQELDRIFGIGIDSVEQAMDGGIEIDNGCDWLSLTPHTVITRNEIG